LVHCLELVDAPPHFDSVDRHNVPDGAGDEHADAAYNHTVDQDGVVEGVDVALPGAVP
jgi:hypothetical protein